MIEWDRIKKLNKRGKIYRKSDNCQQVEVHCRQ